MCAFNRHSLATLVVRCLVTYLEQLGQAVREDGGPVAAAGSGPLEACLLVVVVLRAKQRILGACVTEHGTFNSLDKTCSV